MAGLLLCQRHLSEWMVPGGERLGYWRQGGSDFAQEEGTLLGSSFVHSIVAQGAQRCQVEEKCLGVPVELRVVVRRWHLFHVDC